jgi:hypothetical protein
LLTQLFSVMGKKWSERERMGERERETKQKPKQIFNNNKKSMNYNTKIIITIIGCCWVASCWIIRCALHASHRTHHVWRVFFFFFLQQFDSSSTDGLINVNFVGPSTTEVVPYARGLTLYLFRSLSLSLSLMVLQLVHVMLATLFQLWLVRFERMCIYI